MLIGSSYITENELEVSATSGNRLRKIAESKVPKIFRHVTEIVDNQIYYIALLVRKQYSNDYNKWHPVVTEALEGVKITGCLDDIRTCEDLLRSCDLEVLKTYIGRR